MKKIMLVAFLWSVNFCKSALDTAAIDGIMRGAIQRKVFPGAVVSVGKGNDVLFRKAYGAFTYDKNATAVSVEDTYYDIASITKMFTTLITLKFIDSGLLALDTCVGDYFPELLGQNKKCLVTLCHLLTHHSGLEDFALDGSHCLTRESLQKFCVEQLRVAVPGQKQVYRNSNMVVLQILLEKVSGISFERLVEDYVIKPLGMKSATFNPIDEQKKKCAPTTSNITGAFLQGVVHDMNAQVMGGVSGHAGLFSSVQDIEILARFFINKGKTDAGVQYISAELIEESKQPKFNSIRGYGWHLARYFSPQAYGHFGFTGTSLWIDPATGYYGVLLTNRAYESKVLSYLVPVREEFYAVIKRAIE